MTVSSSFSNCLGCQKNGEDAQNIHGIGRVINPSSENTPEWEELEIQVQHPRTDCGFFQLGIK